MSAEAEAGEILVRIMGQGISEMIRLSGSGAQAAGRGALSILSYCYALKVGGSPKEIAKNPGGMAIVTIPEDRLEEFRKASKAYKFQFFTVESKDFEKGYLDICLRAEDVATCKRVLELTGITSVKASSTETLSKEESVTRQSVNFEEAKEKLKAHTQTIEEAFNRRTEKDFARETPYIVCDRCNPKNYVLVHPEKAEFEGQSYTRSVYQTFKGGKQTGIFNDGKFSGRQKDFWPKLREEIGRNAGFEKGSSDLVYFRNPEAHQDYLNLEKGVTRGRVIEITSERDGLNFEGIKDALNAAGVGKSVPPKAPKEKDTKMQGACGTGQALGKNEKREALPNLPNGRSKPQGEEESQKRKGGVKAFAAEFKKKTEKAGSLLRRQAGEKRR